MEVLENFFITMSLGILYQKEYWIEKRQRYFKNTENLSTFIFLTTKNDQLNER
jgi:hypothetical protein